MNKPCVAIVDEENDMACGESGQDYRVDGLPSALAFCDAHGQAVADQGKKITALDDSGRHFVSKPPKPTKRKDSENQITLFAGFSDTIMKPEVESKFSPTAAQMRVDAGAFDIAGRSAGQRRCRSRLRAG